MKPREEMEALEVQGKFKIGQAVVVCNKFSVFEGLHGHVLNIYQRPAYNPEVEGLYVNHYDVKVKDDIIYCEEWELEEDKDMDASDSTNWNQELIDEYVDEHPHDIPEEKKADTYLGLIKGHIYKLKHHHYPMKEGDNVIVTGFSPTYGDEADVQVRHPLYGTYLVNHSKLEETIQPVKREAFKPGDHVNLRADYKTWGISLSYPGAVLVVIKRDNLEETECYWLHDADGNTWYAPAEIMFPVDAQSEDVDHCNVNKEHHYDGEVQPIELMQAQMTKEAFIGFLRGNIIKYAARLGKKDAPEKEAKKIQTYANWLVKVLNNQEIHP